MTPVPSGSPDQDRPLGPTGPPIRSTVLVGIATGGLALFLCLITIQRPFGFDESVTVRTFVTAPSILDAATLQVRANNHQAISILDHLVWSALGTTTESVLRILPTLFFVTATISVTAATTRRWGWKIGLVAGVLLCTNPMVLQLSSEIRGYGLMMLCAIATSLVLDAIRRNQSLKLGLAVGYLALATIGVSAQLYMLLPLAMQTAVATFEPSLRRHRAAVLPVVGTILGLAIQASLLMETLSQRPPRSFQPGFPLELLITVLGSSFIAALATAVLVIGPVWKARLRLPLVAAAATLVAITITLWAIAPADLYPRFFISLSPAIAATAAVGAARLARRDWYGPLVAGALLAAILTAHVITIWPTIWRPDLANREAATLIEDAVNRSARACVLVSSAQPLMAYTTIKSVGTEEEFRECDLVISLVPELDRPAMPALERMFAFVTVLDDAETEGRLYSRVPSECVLGGDDRCWGQVPADGP